MNYLHKLKEKCNLDDKLMSIIDFLFKKLLEFGYIDDLSRKKLEKKLYNNVNAVFVNGDKNHDYKTGYYDAIKKELYLKNIDDLEATFLRIVYAITTTETAKEKYDVGYSKTNLSSTSYKQEHTNFGLNRAVVSNLVCRLLYTEPTTLSIVPSYRTYTNDFLGNGIITDNNIYFLEGQLLKQLCFSIGVQEEDLYYHLFTNPNKYLSKFILKSKIENSENLINLLDHASKNYSNYNKLLYFNKLLGENYLNSKKILIDDVDEDFEKEKINLHYSIAKLLNELENNTDEEEEFENVEGSLTEKINKFEEDIIETVIEIQNIFVSALLSMKNKYSPVMFLIKQKELQKLLIFKNEDLEDCIYNTLTYKILYTFESSSSNLIEKMKYSIMSEILSSEKYIKIYNNMDFHRLVNLDFEDNTEMMVLSVDDTFLQLMKITDLNKPFKDLKDNTEIIKLDNMKFILNNPISLASTQNIEKIYTYIKDNHEKYKTIEIEKLYIANIDKHTLVLVLSNDSYDIFKMDIIDDAVTCKTVALSEKYEIFDISKVSYSNKKYKDQQTESFKLFGIF